MLVEPGAGALAEPEGKSYEFCIDIDIVLTLSILLAINNNKNEVNNYMYFDEQIFYGTLLRICAFYLTITRIRINKFNYF